MDADTGDAGIVMNTIDRRLERLRARLSDLRRERAATRPILGLRCFRVTSGNVVIYISEADQNAAFKCFGRVLAMGQPFDDSALSDVTQIKDMESDAVWYASTTACLSAINL